MVSSAPQHVTVDPVRAEGIFDSPNYHQAVRAEGWSRTISVAGQVSVDERGVTVARGDFASQTRHVLNSIRTLLVAGGAEPDHIIKLTVYVTDARYRTEFAAVRADFFGPKSPPITMVVVAGLMHPDWLIEIDALAVA